MIGTGASFKARIRTDQHYFRHRTTTRPAKAYVAAKAAERIGETWNGLNWLTTKRAVHGSKLSIFALDGGRFGLGKGGLDHGAEVV